jgi:hypothetical protein
MVTLIIDSIIDNYERRLTSMRESLSRTVTELAAMTEKYEKADDANIALVKERDQLKRELDTAKLDQLRTMDHLIAAVQCITDPSICDEKGKAALRDALYAIPSDAVTLIEQTHIDALAQAIDRTEKPG